jgi:hypothetical protein
VGVRKGVQVGFEGTRKIIVLIWGYASTNRLRTPDINQLLLYFRGITKHSKGLLSKDFSMGHFVSSLHWLMKKRIPMQ